MKARPLSLILLTFLAACAGAGPASDYKPFLAKKGIHSISAEALPHCRGYGCRFVDQVSLQDKEWKRIARIFKRNRSASEERTAVAAAIGILETVIGKKTGTDEDVAGTYVKLGDHQHDCVDESVNTTIYLALLEQKKLLKFHDVSAIMARVPVVGGGLGPHQTAVIVERKTKARFAVDSWFHDNGAPAEIVSLDQWVYGWRPKS